MSSDRPRRQRRVPRGLAALVLLTVLAAACGGEGTSAQAAAEPTDWEAVLAEADGQNVRWWMFGGDQRVNTYVDEHVAPAALQHGVTLERVPVADTADALRRVVAEHDAGRESGSVDLIWINGQNFAAGKDAGLWLEDWATHLPNAALVDWDDDTIATDFGVAVDGQSSPWSRAAFVFAHDVERLPDPPRSLEELLVWAGEHPGRFTYPAPPDFTGSAFVRQVVAALGEGDAMTLLAELKPLQWREGTALPGSEAELSQLFGDGVVDIAMSYDPTFVATGVLQGGFAPTVRPFVLDDGTLQNTSYVTIPGNAVSRAGALVVADLLLEPELQAVKADPAVWGMPTVLDLDRLDAEQRRLLSEGGDGEHVLVDLGALTAELPVDRVEAIDRRWRDEVLR
jgi:putative spermidine/putrescine transport system substrate-binding protein